MKKKRFLRCEHCIKVRTMPSECDNTVISNPSEDRTNSDLLTGTLQRQLHNQIVTKDQLKGVLAEVMDENITLKLELDGLKKRND